MADTKYPPLLKNTPFVGSASNRVVHRTDSNCPRALEISPNERWYIKDIPHDGNYLMCPFCFPQPETEEEGEVQPEETPAPVKTRRRFGVKDKSDPQGPSSSRWTEDKPSDLEVPQFPDVQPEETPAPVKTRRKAVTKAQSSDVQPEETPAPVKTRRKAATEDKPVKKKAVAQPSPKTAPVKKKAAKK